MGEKMARRPNKRVELGFGTQLKRALTMDAIHIDARDLEEEAAKYASTKFGNKNRNWVMDENKQHGSTRPDIYLRNERTGKTVVIDAKHVEKLSRSHVDGILRDRAGKKILYIGPYTEVSSDVKEYAKKMGVGIVKNKSLV